MICSSTYTAASAMAGDSPSARKAANNIGQPVNTSSISSAENAATPLVLRISWYTTSCRALPGRLCPSNQADMPDARPAPITTALPCATSSTPAAASVMATTDTVDDDCATSVTATPSKNPSDTDCAVGLSRSCIHPAYFSGAAPVLMKSMPKNRSPKPSNSPTRWR